MPTRHLYIVPHAELPFFKIGIANQPAARLQAIRSAAGKLKLDEAWIVAGEARDIEFLERSLHWAFGKWREPGATGDGQGKTEWFKVECLGRLMAHLRELLGQLPTPLEMTPLATADSAQKIREKCREQKERLRMEKAADKAINLFLLQWPHVRPWMVGWFPVGRCTNLIALVAGPAGESVQLCAHGAFNSLLWAGECWAGWREAHGRDFTLPITGMEHASVWLLPLPMAAYGERLEKVSAAYRLYDSYIKAIGDCPVLDEDLARCAADVYINPQNKDALVPMLEGRP